MSSLETGLRSSVETGLTAGKEAGVLKKIEFKIKAVSRKQWLMVAGGLLLVALAAVIGAIFASKKNKGAQASSTVQPGSGQKDDGAQTTIMTTVQPVDSTTVSADQSAIDAGAQATVKPASGATDTTVEPVQSFPSPDTAVGGQKPGGQKPIDASARPETKVVRPTDTAVRGQAKVDAASTTTDTTKPQTTTDAGALTTADADDQDATDAGA